MSLNTSLCTTVCRICLAIDARTFPLSETPLQSVFEKLTSTALHTHDKRPVAACYICYHQLLKSYKLIQMSVKAENVLTDIFKRCNKITKQSVSLVNRNATSRRGYLCISSLDYYSYNTSLPPPEKESYDVKLEMKDEDQNKIETDMYEEDTEADVDLEDAVPCSLTQQATDIKEENTDGGTSVYKTETHIQKQSKHLIPISTSQRRHECNICLKTFTKKRYLEQHLMVHSDEKPFKCQFCSSRFRTKYHINRHLMAIHNKNTDPIIYRCEKCGSKFKDRTQFRIHTRTHVYECNYCQKQISKRPEFINHLRTHTGERFKCNICQVSFTQKSSLSFHLKKHKDSEHAGQKLLDCDICNVKLSESDMKVHSKIHKKNLECSVCQQRFKKQCLLVEHITKHTGERPFECNECHKRFATKPNLKAHLKTHSGEKPHKCNHCTYASLKRGELNRHMRQHTGEKPFECSVCQRRFRYKYVLTLHMRTHTGEKPFKCHVCEQRFIDQSNMNKHILKRHT